MTKETAASIRHIRHICDGREWRYDPAEQVVYDNAGFPVACLQCWVITDPAEGGRTSYSYRLWIADECVLRVRTAHALPYAQQAKLAIGHTAANIEKVD